LLDKAKSLYLEGKYEEAITWIDKALEIDPGNAQVLNSKTLALYNKGLTLDNIGNHEEAITWYDKALEIDPVNIDILNNKCRCNLEIDTGLP
jgi:tetratricopeptide (TPR) repeat protein